VNDLVVHLLLFGVISVAIVTLGAFYSEPDDAKALRSLPRRLAAFVIGCTVLAAIVLVCEHTFASLG
jgi:predicted neutral ceramidase superfamily lipid hydrolase